MPRRHDEEEPPRPSWLEERLLEQLVEQAKSANAHHARLVELAGEHEERSRARHADLVGAVRAVDDRAPSPGLVAAAARVLRRPAVQAALALALVQALTAGGAYVAYRLTAAAPGWSPAAATLPADVVDPARVED